MSLFILKCLDESILVLDAAGNQNTLQRHTVIGHRHEDFISLPLIGEREKDIQTERNIEDI
jgi:hypothetical protein